MLLTLVSFLFAIGLLVTVHEYGHYRIAKTLGVKVLTFSIGFGKPLLKWQCGETQWQIAAIPLGGFVRMLGEDEDQSLLPIESARAFNRQHPLRKMAIVVAGPLANLVLAWLFFSAALLIGVDSIKPVAGSIRVGSPMAISGLHIGDEIVRLGGRDVLSWDDLRLAALTEMGFKTQMMVRSPDGAEHDLQLNLRKTGEEFFDANILARLGLTPIPLLNRIAQVESGSVAAQAGLQAGDSIVAANDNPIAQWESLQDIVAKNPGRTMHLSVRRSSDLLDISVTPSLDVSSVGPIGRLGVMPQVDEVRFTLQKFTLQMSLFPALQRGGQKVWDLSSLTFRLIGQMLIGKLSSRQISGPIGMASMAGESAGLGLTAYLQYLAMISLSLGVLNLLPVPVLDGGHLLYHSAELVRGRPLPESWFIVGQRLGIALLVGLMLLALYNDIHRFIPG
ncbi:MAG: RIP metalloprotease RseP [Formivibrio sp.]|nr:RIP metalloprotease RseP [Formivibrio sp.]